jgi:hypothetical protein
VLPDGRTLTTLKDAGNYITKLPKAEHHAPEWQAAMEALILVAENGGPTMFARKSGRHSRLRPRARVRSRSRRRRAQVVNHRLTRDKFGRCVRNGFQLALHHRLRSFVSANAGYTPPSPRKSAV